MTFRKLGLLGLTVVAGILAACDGETVVVPPPPDTTPDIVLTVIPDTATLFINGTRQLAAVVTGSTNQAVTWTSSSDAIATVSATGLVTGRAVGAAIVTAVSTADARARDAATINVIAVPTASIVITNVTQGGVVQAPTNLSGPIEVNAELNVPQGAQVQRIEFLLDNVIQANCTQTFQSGGSADLEVDEAMVPIVCAINTAAFNATTGAASFPNGPHRVSAQVVSPAGTVVASSQQDLTFNNTNIVRVTLTPERTANGPTGLAWVGGTLGVTAIPTIYAGGNVSSVTFNVDDNAAGGSAVGVSTRTQAVTAAGPVTVTFPTTGANSVAGFEDAGTVVTVNTTIGGNAGPTATQTIRLDEVAPTSAGALTFPQGSNGWVGPNVSIASMTTDVASPQNATPFTAVDAGVNVVVKSVQFKTAAAAASAFATVNAINDLTETGTNTDLDFRGRACDALLNCANLAQQDGGVDKTAPTNVAYTPTSPANQSIVVGPGVYALTGSDGLSGPNDFLATLQRLNTNGTTTCVVGAVPATGVCNRVSSLTATFTQQATEGYYTFGGGSDSPDLVFRDQALNTTSIAGRIAVRDVTIPAVQNIVLPPTLPSGGTAAFSANATDNLDINASTFRTIYAAAVNGGAELTYSGPTQVGAFGAPLLQTSPLTASVSFIRSIQATGAGGVVAGGVIASTGARFDVSDFGGNTATAFNNFAAGTVPAGSSATALGLTDWNGATSDAAICDNVGPTACAAGTPTSANLTGIARGTSGTFAFPFARVIFYINTGGVRTFIGETTVRASADNGVAGDPVGRVWTFGPVAFSGTGRGGPTSPGSVAYNIEAVGVDAAGDALFSQLFVVTVNRP